MTDIQGVPEPLAGWLNAFVQNQALMGATLCICLGIAVAICIILRLSDR